MADSNDHTDPDAQLREVLEDLRDDPVALIEIILQQAQKICRLTARVEELEEKVRELTDETERLRKKREEVEREGKRQAAPFRTDEEKRSSDPDPPGREEGHEASYRQEPEQIDRRVDVPMEDCPECGEAVTEVRPIRQVVEELPPIEPETVEVVTYRGECRECGTVETTHRLKTTEATGAAHAHLGPRAQAVALLLRQRHGLTMRRACGVLKDGFGLNLSPGGLAQMIQRCASRLEAEDERLLEATRSSEVQHVDETSWWVVHPNKGQPRRQPQGKEPLW